MAQITNNNGDLSFGSLVNFLTSGVSNIEDRTGSSLFQYTRRTIINSRVFIDDTLRGEDILNPLMMNLMNLYAGLILTAINVDRQVTSTKTVRDSLSVVATEDYKVEFANDLMSKYFKGCSIRSTMADPVVTPADPNAAAAPDDEDESKGKKKNGESTPADHDPQRNTETEYRTKEFMNDVPIPSGRIVQVKHHQHVGLFDHIRAIDPIIAPMLVQGKLGDGDGIDVRVGQIEETIVLFDEAPFALRDIHVRGDFPPAGDFLLSE